MAEISYLKLYTFGRLTITDRVQPVDKISPTIMNLLKEPEYEVSINVIDAIDNFMCRIDQDSNLKLLWRVSCSGL